MKSHRLARVAEVVREVAAEAILFEVRDPRVKGVTVTRAEVSADLQHAKVFVSVMGSEKDQQLTMHGLKSSAGFVQTKLAKRLTTRFVPHVTFVIDEGVKKSLEISRILNEEKQRAGGTSEAPIDDPDEDATTGNDTLDSPASPADGPADR